MPARTSILSFAANLTTRLPKTPTADRPIQSVLPVAGTTALIERSPVGGVGIRVVKFAANDKIDVLAGIQRFVRLDVAVRSNESHFQRGIAFLDFPQQLDIAVKTHGGGKQHEELVVLADLYGLLPVDFMWGSVKQPAARNQPGRVS